MSLYEELSKEVGWGKRDNVPYPSTSMVREALNRHNRQDIKQLILWNRYLDDPQTTREKSIIKIINDGLITMRI